MYKVKLICENFVMKYECDSILNCRKNNIKIITL